MSRPVDPVTARAQRRSELFSHILDDSQSDTAWEYCALRTTQDDRLPKLFYFNADGHFEMDIVENREKGDRSAGDALRRAIGMLGQAGWELVTDAYFESRWLDHGRRELYFKRKLKSRPGQHF